MVFGLEGIKVVDISQVAAVPMAARFLGDWGADVVHVEHPQAGDSFRVIQAGMSAATGIQSDINYIWEHYNRNKRGITVDLSQEGGQEIIYRLARGADVFLTNLRPYEIERYRVSYDTLSRMNPRLIYGSLTGFGKKGADSNAPAYDHNSYWARSGIPHRVMSLMPEASTPGASPPAFLPAFGDHMAAMTLACGVMTALYVREKTGVGQEIDISLFQCGVYQLSFDMSGTLVTGQDCRRRRTREDNPNPLSTVYETKDGRWLLLIGLRPQRYWPQFCAAIGRPDLERDPRFATLPALTENRVALMHILDEVFKSKTLEEWKPVMRNAGFPWSPIQNLPEVTRDPQARANDFFVAYDHPAHGRIEGVANPVNLSKTRATVRMPAPQFGQHTEEVLLELGYNWEDIARLKEHKTIG